MNQIKANRVTGNAPRIFALMVPFYFSQRSLIICPEGLLLFVESRDCSDKFKMMEIKGVT